MKNFLFLALINLGLCMKKYSDKLDINDFESGSCFDTVCNYCCLSTNQCGSLEECRERKLPIFLLETIFYLILAISLYLLAWQCFTKGKGVNART